VFRTASYTSAKLALRTAELADNLGHPLQAQTPLDSKLINTYDVPPYVNSADQSGAVPFLDIDNHDILAGAQYNPQVLAGLSAAQIASQLSNPSSPVAKAIDGSATVIIAAINQARCLLVGRRPGRGGRIIVAACREEEVDAGQHARPRSPATPAAGVVVHGESLSSGACRFA
jgi:hypothetical protein